MDYSRVVIKVGSHVLSDNGSIAENRMENMVDLIASLMGRGKDVILVSSGAVSAGYTVLKLDKSCLGNKQVLASIGQPLIMKMYQEKFAKHNILCSQVLLSASDLDSKKRSGLARMVINNLLSNGVVPIINENDVIAIEELVFGDNDQLSASVTYNFNAELLVILSDIDGFYDKDPRKFKDASIQKRVSKITKEELNSPTTPNNEFATGGIVTKLKAANFLLNHDKKMFLTSGFDLKDAKNFLLNGKQTGGTLFVGQ